MAETFYKKEVEKYQYFQLPKWLFKEPYKKLPNDAKIMYAFLYNRLDLSLKNEWHDDNGEVYVYFTNTEFCEELGLSEGTVTKNKGKLRDAGLLREVRQGITKPNRLYIKGPSILLEPQELGYRTPKNTVQDQQKLQTIKTDISKTDIENNIGVFKEIIDYLNLKAGKKYSAKRQATQKHINARLADGYTLDDFKHVIDVKVKEWKGTEMDGYLRPDTLFGPKFENYVNQQADKGRKEPGQGVDERLGF